LLLNQLRAIAAEGYDVTAISSRGPHVDAVTKGGVRHLAVPMTRRISPLRDLLVFLELYRVMRREHFTVVHTHTPKPALFGQIAANLAGVPVVINTIHGFTFHDDTAPAARRLLILLEKISAKFSDLIFSQNADDLETAVREGIAPRDTLRYLGNG